MAAEVILFFLGGGGVFRGGAVLVAGQHHFLDMGGAVVAGGVTLQQLALRAVDKGHGRIRTLDQRGFAEEEHCRLRFI